MNGYYLLTYQYHKYDYKLELKISIYLYLGTYNNLRNFVAGIDVKLKKLQANVRFYIIVSKINYEILINYNATINLFN